MRFDYTLNKNYLVRIIDAAEELGMGIYRLRQLIKSGAPLPGLCQDLNGTYWIARWGIEELRWQLAKAKVTIG